MNKTALPKIQLLLALTLAMSMNTAIAEDTEVTHTIVTGQAALAAEVNTNFTDLATAIDLNKEGLAELSTTVGEIATVAGPQGEQGQQGVAGPQGLTGSTGPAGARGDTGPRGPVGTNGNDGTNGTDGVDGIACWDTNGDGVNDPAENINGDAFFTAADCQGLAGADGPNGVDGTNGTDGAPGVAGANGTNGANGTDGLAGYDSIVPGPQGIQGEIGPQGPAAHIALVPPTVNDDVNSPYTVGSIWVNTTKMDVYILLNATANAAVWKALAFAPTYTIGDTGPAGGIVFHVTDVGLHGLEAAPVDSANSPWGCFGTVISGADGTDIGTGIQNTADIVAGCATAGIAARVANDFSLNGFADWFLPSKDELNQLYLQRIVVGGFFGAFYWSSSEVDDETAWDQYFGGGFLGNDRKSITYNRVRAVRAF